MTTQSPRHTIIEFFDHYRAHDLDAMIQLFEPKGEIEYVPFQLKGPVEEMGPGSWGVFIDAFPNLSNHVHSIQQDELGRTVFADVNISGTQEQDAFGVKSQGRTYDLRHLFIFTLNDSGKITKVTSFWDNADWYKQLGKVSL